jgi:hypothetical protein
MSHSYTEFASIDHAMRAITDLRIIQRLEHNDLTVVTEIEADYLLKRAVEMIDGGLELLTQVKEQIKQNSRPMRTTRVTKRYSPSHSDSGRRWVKGSGGAGVWSDRRDPTDRYDWDMHGDGGPEFDNFHKPDGDFIVSDSEYSDSE